MIDRKDKEALLKAGVYAIVLCLGSLFVAAILGISLHVFRSLAGV